MMGKRTKKEFTNYNDYYDRPFGLKWGTAFALDELMQVVNKNKSRALRKVEVLEQMDREAIDSVLQLALLKSLRVSVQTNHKDDWDQLLPSIQGSFQGYADDQCFYLDDYEIEWEWVRNVSII